jgi:hypothetical protein
MSYADSPAPAVTTVPGDSSQTPFDFRKARWGMAREEVIKSEGPPLEGSETYLVYNSNVMNVDVRLGFEFIDNKLSSTYYIFKITHTNHTNYNDFISDFNAIDEALASKYGHSVSSGPIWKQSSFNNDPEHYGLAVATGKLIYQGTWETSGTKICHRLWGDNFQMHHFIRYESKDLSPAVERQNSKKAVENL